MSEETLQERTEQATPKRREDARKKGQVLRSAELSSVAVLGCSLAGLAAFGPLVTGTLAGLAVHHFEHLHQIQPSLANLPQLAADWMWTFAKAAAAPALVAAVAGVGSAVLQVGWKPSFEALEIKWERFNLAEGLGRLVGRRSLFQLARDVLKLMLIAGTAYFAIQSETDRLPYLTDCSLGQIASLLGAMSLRVGFKITAALLVIAAVDFAYQRFDFEKNLRMTRQQVKEESKQLEGDPQVRSRVRQVQRELSRRRMLEDLAGADVVVTNPTHLSVALRYRQKIDAAPVVVAKGADTLALRIRETARQLGIPVIENVPLARSLYRLVKIGVQIPESLFEAAAAVLAMAYRLKDERA
jgi:flagellar biosynthetic protein FlhB